MSYLGPVFFRTPPDGPPGALPPRRDLDFLVEFAEPTFANFMGLIRALEKLFGRRVDVPTPEGLNSIRVRSVGESIRKSLAYV